MLNQIGFDNSSQLNKREREEADVNPCKKMKLFISADQWLCDDVVAKISVYHDPKTLLNWEMIRKTSYSTERVWQYLSEDGWENLRQVKGYDYRTHYCETDEPKERVHKWSYYQATMTEQLLELLHGFKPEEWDAVTMRKIKKSFFHALKCKPNSPISILLTYLIYQYSRADANEALSRKQDFIFGKDRIYEAAFNEGIEGESMIQSLLEFFSYYRSPVKDFVQVRSSCFYLLNVRAGFLRNFFSMMLSVLKDEAAIKFLEDSISVSLDVWTSYDCVYQKIREEQQFLREVVIMKRIMGKDEEVDRLEFKGKREANFVLDCQFIETNKSRKIKRDWVELY